MKIAYSHICFQIGAKMQVFSIIATKIIPLLTAMLGFGIVIFIHEFGHFIFCKIFGIRTPTFSIGWGPSIISFKIGETNFQIAPLPVGGYCEIDSDETFRDKPGNFYSIGYIKRMMIILGGILFNFLGAFGVYTYLYHVPGMPIGNLTSITIKNIHPDSIVFDLLKPEDKILGISKQTFQQTPLSITGFQKEIISKKGSDLSLLILPKDSQTASWVNIAIPPSDKIQGILGANLQQELAPDLEPAVDINSALHKAWTKVTTQALFMASGILNLIVKEKSLEGMAGPVMILSESFKIASTDFLQFLLFMSFLSINLALLNILPLGILDGGRAFTTTLEAILQKPLPTLAMLLQVASIFILGGLFCYLTAKELYLLALGFLG